MWTKLFGHILFENNDAIRSISSDAFVYFHKVKVIMSVPDESTTPKLTDEDLKVIMKHYGDKTGEGTIEKLTQEERQKMVNELVKDYNDLKLKEESLLKALKSFDINHDGVIDDAEKQLLDDHLNSALRYAGYSAVFSRAFRYLAFTSGIYISSLLS